MYSICILIEVCLELDCIKSKCCHISNKTIYKLSAEHMSDFISVAFCLINYVDPPVIDLF